MKPSNESDRGELEPDAPRGARPVLRGRGAGDNTPLPGTQQDDPLYTIARYTTAQAAATLGITQIAVQAAIRRGALESEAISPRLRLVSQAAIDAYRANHLGQVGKPSRKKQRMKRKAEAAKAAAADGAAAAPLGTEETHD